jgi:glutamate dehydrogenase
VKFPSGFNFAKNKCLRYSQILFEMLKLSGVLHMQWIREVELIDVSKEPRTEDKNSFLDALAKMSSTQSASSSSFQSSTASNILNKFADELKLVVPWFEEQMPPLYHWMTSEAEKQTVVSEIVSGRVLSAGETVERSFSDSCTTLLIAPGENGLSAVKLAPSISKHIGKSISLVTSVDKRCSVCTVDGSPYASNAEWKKSPYASTFEKKRKSFLENTKVTPENADIFLNAIDSQFAKEATIKMLEIAYLSVEHCLSNENSYVQLTTVQDDSSENRFRVDIGIKGFPVHSAVENVIGIFNRYNFVVRRVLAHEHITAEKEQFTVLSVVASLQNGEVLNPEMMEWYRTQKGLKTLSYVDHGDDFSTLLQGSNPRSLNETNLARAMANWTHIFLTKVNPYYYSLDRVSRILLRNDAFLDLSIKYFRIKFDPKFKQDRISLSQEVVKSIEGLFSEITDEVEKTTLRESFSFIQNILKTNYFVVSKGGLSFRMNPKVLNKTFYSETPFGIFYMIGRDYRGFQVRYRDISRGGVRVVCPKTSADYENALAGLFDEVNGLASAQQLKNKDIPEGGSKCVLVVRPGGSRHHAVKAAISGLLDLIIVNAKTGQLDPAVVDEFGQEEIIYLGPDENMTDDLITWTIQHALHRGYRYAYAFMSSKPDFGINHKTYGVTSEGVNVYLDNVLKYLKLNSPGSTFRVKMTGGPDGDVAGNELKILHREYGERAKVVAIADGYGCAYDPSGLDWPELLRLVAESKSIVDFSKAKLSQNNKAFVISSDTKENIKTRDNLYATVEAEIFIPAGGRPYTVKESNWQRYLKTDGRPSSLAIIEGANIFFTPEARMKIMESGVVVIKDSSANKAGVICSSYEIIACLTLSPEEFASIKSVYVQQVIETLREKADNEAKLMFREWQKRHNETNLVDLSYEVSKEINIAKDVVREKLNRLSDNELNSDKFMFILCQHCPQILVEKFKNRISERLPRAHKIAIISAYMASHLVYKEGLNWLESMDADQVFRIALDYIDAEQTVENMVSEISASSLSYKDKIVGVLRGAGAKHLASSQN